MTYDERIRLGELFVMMTATTTAQRIYHSVLVDTSRSLRADAGLLRRKAHQLRADRAARRLVGKGDSLD